MNPDVQDFSHKTVFVNFVELKRLQVWLTVGIVTYVMILLIHFDRKKSNSRYVSQFSINRISVVSLTCLL